MIRLLTAILLMLCMVLPAPVLAWTGAADCAVKADECVEVQCACCVAQCHCAEVPERPSSPPAVPPAGPEFRIAATLPPPVVETPAAPFRNRGAAGLPVESPRKAALCLAVPLYVRHHAFLL